MNSSPLWRDRGRAERKHERIEIGKNPHGVQLSLFPQPNREFPQKSQDQRACGQVNQRAEMRRSRVSLPRRADGPLVGAGRRGVPYAGLRPGDRGSSRPEMCAGRRPWFASESRARCLSAAVNAFLLESAGDRTEPARSLADLSVALSSAGELDGARAVSRRSVQESTFCRSGVRPAYAGPGTTGGPTGADEPGRPCPGCPRRRTARRRHVPAQRRGRTGGVARGTRFQQP